MHNACWESVGSTLDETLMQDCKLAYDTVLLRICSQRICSLHVLTRRQASGFAYNLAQLAYQVL